jgi:hypothetical protein
MPQQAIDTPDTARDLAIQRLKLKQVTIQGWIAYGPGNRISEDDVQREMSRG